MAFDRLQERQHDSTKQRARERLVESPALRAEAQETIDTCPRSDVILNLRTRSPAAKEDRGQVYAKIKGLDVQ